jgi:CheY-like chemotaxis protein
MAFTILVVDDESIVREVSSQVLRAAGYDVLTAADGAEALEAASSGRPIDLVILDMGLPGMSGQQLFEALREQSPEQKVLVNSGQDPSDLAPTMRDPNVRVLVKPYRPQVLLDMVEQWLGSEPV